LLANLSLTHMWHKTVKKWHATIECYLTIFFLFTFLDVSLLSLDALHKKKKRRWQCVPWKIWQTCYKFL
jgi:hypothetical protein